MTEADWDQVVDVNLKGTFAMCRHAIPALEASGGCIVNVSSDAGLWGNKGAAIYCASKGGVTVLSKALAVELASRGVRVERGLPGRRRLADDPLPGGDVRRRRSEKYLSGPADGISRRAPAALHPPRRGRRTDRVPLLGAGGADHRGRDLDRFRPDRGLLRRFSSRRLRDPAETTRPPPGPARSRPRPPTR